MHEWKRHFHDMQKKTPSIDVLSIHIKKRRVLKVLLVLQILGEQLLYGKTSYWQSHIITLKKVTSHSKTTSYKDDN